MIHGQTEARRGRALSGRDGRRGCFTERNLAVALNSRLCILCDSKKGHLRVTVAFPLRREAEDIL